MDKTFPQRVAAVAVPAPVRTRPLIRLAAGAAAGLVLAGCASFSADGGIDRVSALTRARAGQGVSLHRTEADRQAATARVQALLRQPLAADAAVEVALLNNPGLQARLAGVGIAEADFVRAGRLPNPALRFGRLAGGGDVEIDRGILFSLLGVLTLPVQAQLGRQHFEQAQLQAAQDAVALATEARKAYFHAVAAAELLKYQGQVTDAAEASSELGRRMAQAGNWSRLAQMREQAFHAEAAAQLARARQQAVAERERLNRLLGLSGDALTYTLPERLPDLPPAPAAPVDAERSAMENRLDVLLARQQAQATADALGLTRATRFINVLDAGYQNRSASGSPRANGYELELELPLFDFGASRAAQAEARYMQAVNHTAQVAVNARSQVRESYAAYRSAWDVARHYRDEVVPLRKRIADENLLRYNGMLIGPFELLADAREQILGVTGAVQALRDFWLAQADLQAALTAGLPGAPASPSATPD